MQYASNQGFTAWAYAYQNDYTAISLNSTGYISFNNGLIIQFGKIKLTAGSTKVTYPIVFTSYTTFSMIATRADNVDTATDKTTSISAHTSERAYCWIDTSSTLKNINVYWLAIGY